MLHSRRSVLATLAVAASVGLAGCGLFSSRTDRAERGELPPGIGETVVESAWDLATTHLSLLTERGYTAESVTTRTAYSTDGALSESGQWVVRVQVPDARTVLGRYRLSDPHGDDYGPWHGHLFDTDADWFYDGEVTSVRYHRENGFDYEQHTGGRPSQGPSEFTYRDTFEAGLQDASVLAVDRTVDGSVMRVHLTLENDLSKNPRPSAFATARIQAAVGSAGIVRSATIEYVREPDGSPARERLIHRHRFLDIGSTEAERPPWETST